MTPTATAVCDALKNAACAQYHTPTPTPTPTWWPTPTPTPDASSLPMTGMNIVLVALIILALFAAGFALRRATRNRAT